MDQSTQNPPISNWAMVDSLVREFQALAESIDAGVWWCCDVHYFDSAYTVMFALGAYVTTITFRTMPTPQEMREAMIR